MKNVNCAPAAPARRTQPCLLCGRPGVCHSLYIPGQGTPAAPASGKVRVILYDLCERCGMRLDKLTDVIEARIISELRAAGEI